jgi:hypothetical protein
MAAALHVSELVKKGGYPLWYPYCLGDYLLKRGELPAAETLLKATRRFGKKHVLIDKLQSRWFWAHGQRVRAIRFTKKKAKFWSHSCLYNQLSAMYRVGGDDKNADKYLQIFGSLSKREENTSKLQRTIRR